MLPLAILGAVIMTSLCLAVLALMLLAHCIFVIVAVTSLVVYVARPRVRGNRVIGGALVLVACAVVVFGIVFGVVGAPDSVAAIYYFYYRLGLVNDVPHICR